MTSGNYLIILLFRTEPSGTNAKEKIYKTAKMRLLLFYESFNLGYMINAQAVAEGWVETGILKKRPGGDYPSLEEKMYDHRYQEIQGK